MGCIYIGMLQTPKIGINVNVDCGGVKNKIKELVISIV